jgi:hypothetical protein
MVGQPSPQAIAAVELVLAGLNVVRVQEKLDKP